MVVLHLERSSFFQKIIKDIVLRSGLNYIPASSIETAFAQLQEMQVDLIISSVELSDGSGKDFLNKLNTSLYKGTPVIITSSTDTLEQRERLLSMGIVDYILKQDLTFERLNQHIRNLREQHSLDHDLRSIPIAVLDDSELQLKNHKAILTEKGLRNVSYFSDPRDLLDSKKEYAIYLVDLILPKHTGEEVILNIRKDHPRSIILAVSSVSNLKTITQVLLAGADDYVIKPFSADILLARIKTNLRPYMLLKTLELQQVELKRLAETDSMTGLYNHRYILDFISDQLNSGEAEEKGLSILLIDIDNFKYVNDKYGHQIGDEVLMDLSDRMMNFFRDGGTVGRYGGEEFIVVQKGKDVEAFLARSKEFLKLCSSQPFTDEKIVVTFSAGVSVYTGENQDKESLISMADKALYTVKGRGKNDVLLA